MTGPAAALLLDVAKWVALLVCASGFGLIICSLGIAGIGTADEEKREHREHSKLRRVA